MKAITRSLTTAMNGAINEFARAAFRPRKNALPAVFGESTARGKRIPTESILYRHPQFPEHYPAH
jgi:hypothetical protein